MVGRGAVFAAIDGKTGIMMTIERKDGDEYYVTIGSENIANIANEVKKVPLEFINEEGNGISEAGIDYLKPLIIGEIPVKYENGLPKHVII